MSRKSSWAVLGALVALTLLGLVGCGDDDPAGPAGGTLGVLTAPESLATPWTLTGPDGFHAEGTGPRRLAGLAPGTYELTWEAVEGWVRPWPAVRTVSVAAGEAPAISGEYRENVPSTVVLQGDADAAVAAWTLRGSEGLVRQGTGDAVLTDVDAGYYEVVWETPDGWLNTGPTRQRGEVFGAELTFQAGFVADVDLPAGFEFVPAGTFTMGSPDGEWGRQMDELAHEVTLTRDIMVASREVTAQRFRDQITWAWQQGHVVVDTTIGDFNGNPDTTVVVLDNLDGSTRRIIDLGLVNISFSPTGYEFRVSADEGSRPMRGVDWYAAAAYCDWLSLQEGLTRAYDHSDWTVNGGDPYGAEGYRLPTEAEWEYAARAGETDAFTSGPVVNPTCDDPNLLRVGWHCDSVLRNVAGKEANGWGLYDMHGNAWEWCADWWVAYDEGPVTDPYAGGLEQPVLAGTSPDPWSPLVDVELADKVNAAVKVIRGGSAMDFAVICRSANRAGYDPYWTTETIGIRPVRTLPAEER